MPFCVNCGVQCIPATTICNHCFLDPTILERSIDEKLKTFTLSSALIDNIDFSYFGERTSLLFAILTLVFISVVFGALSFGLFFLLILISILNLFVTSLRNRGLMIQATSENFPQLFNLSKVACYRLRVPLLPVYIRQNPEYNAYTQGFLVHGWVVLNHGLLDSFSPEEIAFIMGHEFAHVKRRHTTWLTLMSPGSNVCIPLLPGLLRVIFNLWSLKCEHTADRGGLLVTRNISASVGALVKLATGSQMASQVDWNSLIREHEQKESILTKAAEILGTHPFPMNRIKELFVFNESKTYLKLIKSL